MNDEMPRKLPKDVYMQRTRHGKVVFYHRQGKGKRTRIFGNPGTPEFEAEYHAIIQGQPKQEAAEDVPVRSVRWLVDRYKESAQWASYSPATRKQQGLFFIQLVKNAGNKDYTKITSAHIRMALEDRKDTPSLANNYLKSLRSLFKWALINGHIATNPTIGVDRLKARKTGGFAPWNEEDVVKFCNRWEIGTSARLAFELLRYSGMRRSDIVRAGRQHMNGNVLTLRTVKSGTVVTVEFSRTLLDIIRQTKTGDLNFLVGGHGKPMTVESFGNWFRDCCRSAGIEKAAHGIRKMSATMAANAGATTHELMAQFGWSTTQQAEVYTKGADRVKLGMKTSKLVAEQIEGKTSAKNIKNLRGKR